MSPSIPPREPLPPWTKGGSWAWVGSKAWVSGNPSPCKHGKGGVPDRCVPPEWGGGLPLLSNSLEEGGSPQTPHSLQTLGWKAWQAPPRMGGTLSPCCQLGFGEIRTLGSTLPSSLVPSSARWGASGNTATPLHPPPWLSWGGHHPVLPPFSRFVVEGGSTHRKIPPTVLPSTPANTGGWMGGVGHSSGRAAQLMSPCPTGQGREGRTKHEPPPPHAPLLSSDTFGEEGVLWAVGSKA